MIVKLFTTVSFQPSQLKKNNKTWMAWIKQQKDELKYISSIEWIQNTLILADIFTKKGVKSDSFLAVVQGGQLDA